MHISLPLRLTLFYTLLVSAALLSFGSLVYQQAERRAYADLDATLSSRAASVRLSKDMLAGGSANGNDVPHLLNSVNALGTGGVAIEVLELQDNQVMLLATTTADTQSFGTRAQSTLSSPVPWDKQALQRVALHSENTNGIYSTVMYTGQRVRVYTLLNADFGSRHFIQTARTERDIEQSLKNLRLLLGGGSILVIAFALLGEWAIGWYILKMVRRITQTAQTIGASRNFSQRVTRSRAFGSDELTTLAETFNGMLSNLEQVYQQQQRFIADASHELRAPITSIRCNLDLLARATDLPVDEVQEALQDARSETARMGRLVNDLLVLAHADATHATVSLHESTERMEPVDLDSLLLEVFRQYRPPEQVEECQSGPRLLLQHIVPVQVYGNADALKQVLVAIIDNALKYTPSEGHVMLSLHEEAMHAVIRVRDTGLGMSAEEQAHIFERFYRTDHARTYYPAGGGLGLAIAQRIMQTHEGFIEVVSAPEHGSTFSLHLPIVKNDRQYYDVSN